MALGTAGYIVSHSDFCNTGLGERIPFGVPVSPPVEFRSGLTVMEPRLE